MTKGGRVQNSERKERKWPVEEGRHDAQLSFFDKNLSNSYQNDITDF